MTQLTTSELIKTADTLASDLMRYASINEISVLDLLMVVAFAERLLHAALCGSNPRVAIDAVQEAEATFIAVSTKLESN